MTQYDIKIPVQALRREIFFDRNSGKLSYKDDLGIVMPFTTTTVIVTLPNWLEYDETDKTVWNNGKGNKLFNTSFGPLALRNNTNGDRNTVIGAFASPASTTASHNVAIGSEASRLMTTGIGNVAIGDFALWSNTVSSNNIAIGRFAGYATVGSNNIFIGTNAGVVNELGQINICIGGDVEYPDVVGGTGVGFNSFVGDTSVAIGASSSAYNSSIAIGASALAMGPNQIAIGSTSYPAGTVASQINTSSKYWEVIINGVTQKILLA